MIEYPIFGVKEKGGKTNTQFCRAPLVTVLRYLDNWESSLSKVGKGEGIIWELVDGYEENLCQKPPME